MVLNLNSFGLTDLPNRFVMPLSKNRRKRFQISMKGFHMIFLYHTLLLFIFLQYFSKNFKCSKIKKCSNLFIPYNQRYLSNSRRNSNNSNLLNMKTRSILLAFWVKAVFLTSKFAIRFWLLCILSNSIEQKKPIPQ